MTNLRTFWITSLVTVLAGISVLSAQVVPEALYYKFNEGTGTTVANDASPGEGNAVATTTTATPDWVTPGHLGSSHINFTLGATNPFATGYAFNFTTSDAWTMEFWMNVTGTTTGYWMGGGTATTGVFRGWLTGGNVTVYATGGTTVNVQTQGGGLANGQWNHIAFVYDPVATQILVYVNGTLNNTFNTTAAPTATDFCVGGRSPTDTARWPGQMDEFRFWRSARTQAQIQANMNSELFNINSLSATPGSVSGTAGAGTTDTVVGGVTLNANLTADQDVSDITFTYTGNAPVGDLSNLKLWHDENGTGTVSATDPQLGATATSIVGNQITFSAGNLITVTPGTPVHLLITADIDAAATMNDTISFEIDDDTDITASPGPVLGSYPLSCGEVSVVGNSLQVETRNTGGNIGVGGSDQVAASFRMDATNTADQIVSSLTVVLTGSISPADVSNIKLWRDMDGNGVLSLNDVQLGSTVANLTGNEATFSAATLITVQPGQIMNLLVTADIAGGATLNASMGFTIDDSADITAAPGPVQGAFPMSGGQVTLLNFVSALPWSYGFESPLPGNVQTQVGPGDYPTASGVNTMVSMQSRTNTATIGVTGTEGAFDPRTGTGMGMIRFTAVSAGAYDFYFDLSAYDVGTDQLEFEFYWANDNLTNSTLYDPFNFVFVSNDGGSTWVNAGYFIESRTPAPANDPWIRARVGLTPTLSFFGHNYTNQTVIRIQTGNTGSVTIPRSIYFDDIELRVANREADVVGLGDSDADAPLNPLVTGAGQHNLMLQFDVSAWGGDHSISTLRLEKLGNVADSAVSEIRLWRDNFTGVFNPATSTQVGLHVGGFNNGEVTLTGINNASTPAYWTRRFYVTVTLAASATPGAMLGVRIADAADINFTVASTVLGDFPIDSNTRPVSETVNALPWHTDFNGSALPANVFYRVAVGDYPNATSVGTTVTTGTSTQIGQISWVTASRGTTAYKGDKMLVMHFDNLTRGAAAVDFRFDLSAYNIATDRIEFSARYNENLMSTVVASADFDYVFVSADGGTTWHAAGFYMNPSGTDRIWNLAVVDLQDALAAAGQTYTSNVVVRMQGSGVSYTNNLAIDDVHVRVVTDSLEVRDAGPENQFGAVAPGSSDVLIGAVELIAHGNMQSLTDLILRNIGTTPDTVFADVNLWQDDGDGRFDPSSDTLLTGAGQVVFTGGTAVFTGLTYDIDPGYDNSRRVFVTVDIAGSANPGDTLQLSIEAGDIALSGTDPVVGNFPIETAGRPVLRPTATLPYHQTFNSPAIPANITINGQPGAYPEANATGDTPTMGNHPNYSAIHRAEGVLRGQTAALNEAITPYVGSGMLHFDSYVSPTATNDGVGAVDFHFDLSQFNAARDQLLFSFVWRHYIMTTNNETGHVFISTDGGQNWLTSALRMTMTTATYDPWNFEEIDISSAVRAANGSFSSHVVVRIQTARFSIYTRHMQVDDVRLVRGATIGIERNTNEIQLGGFDNIGTMVRGAPTQLTYTIRNDGEFDLELTDPNFAAFSNTFNAGVTLLTPPANTVIPPGMSEDLVVQVTAVGPGPILFQFEVTSTDTLKSPFIFTVVGTGLAPEIDIQRSIGTSVPDGGTDSIGPRPAGVTSSVGYFVLNQGTSTLTLTGNPPVTVINANNVQVSVTQQPSSNLLPPSGFRDFAFSITPGLGAFSFQFVVPNDDDDEPTYTITVEGNGTTTPRIELRDGTGMGINNGAVITTRNIQPGNTELFDFTIHNTGNAALNLIGNPRVLIATQSNLTFSVFDQPADATVNPGESTTFSFEITPDNIGSFTAELRILSNDPTDAIYVFTLAGFATTESTSGGSDSGGGGCAANQGSNNFTWALILGVLALLTLVVRTRRARA